MTMRSRMWLVAPWRAFDYAPVVMLEWGDGVYLVPQGQGRDPALDGWEGPLEAAYAPEGRYVLYIDGRLVLDCSELEARMLSEPSPPPWWRGRMA